MIVAPAPYIEDRLSIVCVCVCDCVLVVFFFLFIIGVNFSLEEFNVIAVLLAPFFAQLIFFLLMPASELIIFLFFLFYDESTFIFLGK